MSNLPTPVSPSRSLTVELAHAPNPDIQGGGYWEGVPPVRSQIVPVTSLAEASRVCREFIEEWGLGGGNWISGAVRENGTEIARISYNGRAWTPFPFGDPKFVEIVLAK